MNKLLNILRRLVLGLSLIVAASAVLLLSGQQRKSADALRLAIVNYSSTPVLEEGEQGLLDGLASEGFIDGRNIAVKRYNPEADTAAALLVAKEVTSGDADLILTLSTPMLQRVANANRANKKPHVFTLTTDPWGAGIGVSREDHSMHPDYMTGYGSLQPVEALFRLARQAFPGLKTVGVVWNPSEANSEASTVMARKACKDLGIELIEVTVDNSAGVSQAADAVVARGVQAIWAGGDNTVSVAFDALIASARDGKIPVFSNMPSNVKEGALFSLGADYYEVGRAGGVLAARVLRGEDPKDIPVENLMPEQLAVNTTVLAGLDQAWDLPTDWVSRAAILVDEQGVHETSREITPQPVDGKTYQIAAVYFAPDAVATATLDGLKSKLQERGFVAGKNLEVLESHAQGDISLIPSVLQKFDESDVDLIVTLTTPCLTAASTIVKNKPVVFTEVYDPIAAGAGRSAKEHLAHITGVGSFPPLGEMIDTMQMLVPELKAVGTVYNNSEANSRKALSVARELFEQRGLRLEEATVANSSEVLQAAQALTQKDVDVLWEIGDNTVNQGLEGMIKAATQAGLPVVNSDANTATRGATVGVGISFYESGYAAGDLVARVLFGENPANIPFEEVAVVRRAVNLKMAEELNRPLSVDLLTKCSSFFGIREKYGRPARIAFVQLVEGPTLDQAAKGIKEGLGLSGLRPATDFEIEEFNAQGDMAILPQILANVKGEQFDLVVTSTTPAMIAAAQAIEDIPIVFTVASYPPRVGLFPEGQRQPNLVGVYDDPPIGPLIELALKREGRFQQVGCIWNPAEPNSQYSVTKLRAVCSEKGLDLIERHAASVSELPDVTSAICQSGADILVISADNVTSSGFPAILNASRKYNVPIYSTEPDMVHRGAAAAIGDDYGEWGKQSGRLAAKVLAGVPPAKLDFEKTAVQRTLTADDVQ